MKWYQSALQRFKSTATFVSQKINIVQTAKERVSEAVAAKIKDEAAARAYEMLAQTHRSVVTTVLVQNGALVASLFPVYIFHNAWPFYLVYAAVAGYSIFTVLQSWPLVRRLIKTRSMRQTLNEEVLIAIQTELTQRQYYQRAIVEYLGPDLKIVADDVGMRLLPDIRAAVANMVLTLLLAFIAFRLFAIPMLEQRAMG